MQVAHRAHNIRRADNIVLVAEGENHQEGDHEMLSRERDGLYTHMYAMTPCMHACDMIV